MTPHSRLVRLAFWLDPWLTGDRSDRLPWRWEVEQRWPLWRRIPQIPTVLRSHFLVMLNVWPWPMAAERAIRYALRYLRTARYCGYALPHVPRCRYFCREEEIIRAAQLADASRYGGEA